MNGYSESIILREDRRAGSSLSGSTRISTSAGTYSLRRAHYLSESKKPLLSVEQQHALIQLFREGDADAKRKLIAHNMHLVVDFAKCYANRGLALLDLVRVGTQGIIHALEHFELEGDLSFPTYVSRCICRNIEHAIMSQNHSTASLRGHNGPRGLYVNVAKNSGGYDGHTA
jgi:DNA-directed RNA polymerase sigma subunit (sigma70/sigma32)